MKHKSADNSDEKTFRCVCAVFELIEAFDYNCRSDDIKEQVCAALGNFLCVNSYLVGNCTDCNKNIENCNLFACY